ncbi:MAG: N4-gp56 family major capsid protein [Dehalococcoidia bacterium]|nr:N4-gp56 family major capsid protein [Dehalococcoidia bacterium]
MALTDFAALQPQKKRAWGHEAYRVFRDDFWWDRFLGKGEAAVVERITEITKTDKGTASAMLHLVGDLEGGGIVGDNQLQGRESELRSYWQEVNIDRLRKGVKNVGRLSEQKSVIKFREEARDKLGYWMSETLSELMFLTASGVSYAFQTNGAPRVTPAGEDPLTALSFASDVTAPSSGRHFRWTGTALAAGDTTQVQATHLPSYTMLTEVHAEAVTRGIKPIRSGGQQYYIALVHPRTFARLKQDAAFRDAVINAGERGANNPIFTGATLTVDGLVIHTHRKVFNTTGAAAGSKWGATGNVDGTRMLLLGAQALAFADIEAPNWEEEEEDYGNRQGIAIDKIFGLLKPRFYSRYEGSVQDFGVMCVDFAL